MRRKITILWIEDNLNNTIEELQEEVKKIIENAYYEVEILNVSKKIDAERKLKEKHIDLIFSDNNLTENEEGVDFLVEYRLSKKYKYYILYSNLSEKEIVDKITLKLKKYNKIHLFSNFDFISLNTWQDRIDDAMEAFLNNRNKLQELSNMYIVENAIIEDRLKELNFNGQYFQMIQDYIKNNSINNSIGNLWHEVRLDRNALAHGRIEFKNGFNIVIGSNEREVSEKDFDNKVNNLKKLNDELNKLNFF